MPDSDRSRGRVDASISRYPVSRGRSHVSNCCSLSHISVSREMYFSLKYHISVKEPVHALRRLLIHFRNIHQFLHGRFLHRLQRLKCPHQRFPSGRADIRDVVQDRVDLVLAAKTPVAFLKEMSLWPLSLYLPNIAQEKAAVAFAAGIVMMMPPVLLYLNGQSELEQGVAASGVKE